MATGKNKKSGKASGPKKGGKKRVGNPFLKKEWYDLKAPGLFQVKNCGVTLVTKTIGKKLASDGLKGRVYELNLADLNKDDDQSFRKMQFRCEEVHGRSCLLDFYGMDMTRDKLCSLVKKWHTLIEGHVDVTTTDLYQIRIFLIAFTQRRDNQVKTTCYAQSSRIHMIRKRMIEITKKECKQCQLRDLVKKFIPESIGAEVKKKCESIFPIQNVYVRKVKILKRPVMDIAKLMELHETVDEDTGNPFVDESEDAKNLLQQ